MPGLGTSFGRGGATTAQQDLSNSDAILIMGSSMAENHPVGFQWVMEAREKGAKIIHVDPRYTRTSAMADIWVPLRAGSDIIFLGALVHHVIENKKEFRDYVVSYTNASTILREDFCDTDELDGLFSGWDQEKEKSTTPKVGCIKGHPARNPRTARKRVTLKRVEAMRRTAGARRRTPASSNPIRRWSIPGAFSRYSNVISPVILLSSLSFIAASQKMCS